MAKKITGYIKLQLPAGAATPAPPVGPALGQHGVNIMEFVKQFNAKSVTQVEKGTILPVVIYIAVAAYTVSALLLLMLSSLGGLREYFRGRRRCGLSAGRGRSQVEFPTRQVVVNVEESIGHKCIQFVIPDAPVEIIDL